MIKFVVLMLFSIFYILPYTLNSFDKSNDFTEIFELQKVSNMRVSVERDGNAEGIVLVVLNFSDLDLSFPVIDSYPDTDEGIDTIVSEVLFKKNSIHLRIFEKNEKRTRMKIPTRNIPVFFEINTITNQAAFYFGNNRLPIDFLRIELTKILEGPFYELTISGTGVYTYRRFIFDSSKNIIFAVPDIITSNLPDILESDPESYIWAVNFNMINEKNQPEEGLIK